jgi:hypothetical protein
MVFLLDEKSFLKGVALLSFFGIVVQKGILIGMVFFYERDPLVIKVICWLSENKANINTWFFGLNSPENGRNLLCLKKLFLCKCL